MPFMQLQFTDEDKILHQEAVRSLEELRACLSRERGILYLWIQRSYGFKQLCTLPDTLLGLLIEDCTDLIDSPAELPTSLIKVAFNNCPVFTGFAGELPKTIKFLGVRNCQAISSQYLDIAKSGD